MNGLPISAVIPVFNRERTLARAIESALAQEYAAFEVVIVDDGSTDGTRSVSEKYGMKVRRVYQTNSGVSMARNRGVSEARSEWVAFLDSDDYWKPDHLKRMAEVIAATNGEGSLYFADAEWRFKGKQTLYWNSCNFKIEGRYEIRRDAIDWAFMQRQPMLLQSSVLRRSRYLEIGMLPRDLRVQEDTLLFYRYSMLDSICAVAGCGAVLGGDCGNERLTVQYDTRSSNYWICSVEVFLDMAASKGKMSIRWRKAIEDGLVKAHLGLARAFFREGILRIACMSVIAALQVNAGVFARRFLDVLWEYFKNRLLTSKATIAALLGRAIVFKRRIG